MSAEMIDPRYSVTDHYGMQELGCAARREKNRRSFSDYFSRYFAHYATRKATDFHEFLSGVGLSLSKPGAFWNVIGPKETAKSTIITMAAVIYAIATNRKRYVAIMSNAVAIEDHAVAITREITTNRKLLSDYGLALAPKRDTKNQTEGFSDRSLILQGGAKIRFVTPGQSLRGTRHQSHRPDLFIGDDILKRDDYDSRTILDRRFNDVMSEAVATLDQTTGSACFLGNRVDEHGIQGRLAKMPRWKTSIWSIERPDGTFLGKTREEAEALRKLVGEYAWTTDFLCREFDRGRKLFSWESLPKFSALSIAWRDGIRLIGSEEVEWVTVSLDPSRGFDRSRPSSERKGDLDRAAIVVACRMNSGDYRIPWVDIIEDSPASESSFFIEQMRAFANVCSVWRADQAVVESTMFQSLLRDDIERTFDEVGICLRPEGMDQRTRKESRIASLEPMISQGRLAFSDGLPESYQREWGNFRMTGSMGHDDGMDATEMAVRSLRGAGSGPAWFFGSEARH